MIIAQISDSHISQAHPRRMAYLSACVSHINALREPPDVVVHSGDIVHDGTAAQYALAADILAELNAPLYVIPGNKDNRQRLVEAFAPDSCPSLPDGFVQYRVDDFPLSMIFLDTVLTGRNKGALCRHRLSHLQDMLNFAQDKPQVIFMHHPPFEFTAIKDSLQFADWDDVVRLERLLAEAAPRLEKLICGHVHREAAGRIGRFDVSCMASVAVDLRYGEYASDVADVPLYQLHRFDPDLGISSSSVAAPAV